MKRIGIVLITLIIGIGTSSFAQEKDTSKIRIGKKSYTIIVDDDDEIRIITDDKVHESHHVKKKKRLPRMDGTWEGLEFGLANFVDADYQMNRREWSGPS